ncbi:MAG TPA: hypothetical protein VNA04_11205 [Thermoanaerobaculia bacterium]|nr:hypothetical protein [Thermoanaerobaculia bacterium]
MNERIGALLVAALVTGAAYAKDPGRFDQQFQRNLAYRGGPVIIDHRFGSVTVRTGSTSEVGVRATVRSSDSEFGRQIQIDTSAERNGVTIRTRYPERATRHSGKHSYSVDLQITVPPNAPLRVTNRFGSVNASGIAGGSEIVNGHGSIRLTDARGKQTVENSFGSIEVRNIGGDAVVRNSHGSVRAEVIRGSADVTNRFGSVSVAEVDRGAAVKNANGSVSVRDVRGPAAVTNSFASITVQSVTGSVRANGNNARVSVRDARGDVEVTTSFGAVDVQNVGGTLGVANNNGSVKGSNIQGNIAVRMSFGSVTLQDLHGVVDVQNQNGAISVSRLSPAAGCRPISLRTSFSSIKVKLPANASYAVNARTTFGQIKSAFPITTSSIGRESVAGTIGGGSCKLDLINGNGSISIDRE